MPREVTGHSKHPLPTTQEKIYTWTSPNGQHQNQTDYILSTQRRRSSIQSAKTRPGADCGSDHELLIVKFTLKLKKVGKTTRRFRYDLNQIPYDYTVQGILQARILEWVAFPFSRGSSQPRDRTQVSCTAGRFYITAPSGKPHFA